MVSTRRSATADTGRVQDLTASPSEMHRASAPHRLIPQPYFSAGQTEDGPVKTQSSGVSGLADTVLRFTINHYRYHRQASLLGFGSCQKPYQQYCGWSKRQSFDFLQILLAADLMDLKGRLNGSSKLNAAKQPLCPNRTRTTLLRRG